MGVGILKPAEGPGSLLVGVGIGPGADGEKNNEETDPEAGGHAALHGIIAALLRLQEGDQRQGCPGKLQDPDEIGQIGG